MAQELKVIGAQSEPVSGKLPPGSVVVPAVPGAKPGVSAPPPLPAGAGAGAQAAAAAPHAVAKTANTPPTSLAQALGNVTPPPGAGAASKPAGETPIAGAKSDSTQPRPPVSGAPAPASAEPASERRQAKRRPAGVTPERVAANDDVPSIGGLLYSLQQQPSRRPYTMALVATAVWIPLALLFGWATLVPDWTATKGLVDFLARPAVLAILGTTLIPVALIWFLAQLVWRAQELRLMSSAMSEVAIRLAEPDRMAEQSIASLGQAVRRQVSFMNEGVSRALGRAGELEALVHNEVAALERSYQENEHKIRGLIQELAGERHALVNTGDRVSDTLRTLSQEVPTLIDRLSQQQLRLSSIIESAGQNLIQLEGSVASSANQLESTLGTRTQELQVVLDEYSSAVGDALGNRTQQLQAVFEQYTQVMRGDFGDQTDRMHQVLSAQADRMQHVLGSQADRMQGMLTHHTEAVGQELGTQTEQLHNVLETYTGALGTALGSRTEQMQAVLVQHGQSLDAVLTQRAEMLDSSLIERTRALDEVFAFRLQALDESILRSTMTIDTTVSEKAHALTSALETHARQLTDTLGRQAHDIDESLVQGLAAVRRTSENITRQSVKAIEGLSGQADMLRNVSENLLQQIGGVTNRFENQGQAIMKAANNLEAANYRIDSTLQNRNAELTHTLEQLSGKAGEFDKMLAGYSTSIEGSMSDVELRTRNLTQQLTEGAQSSSAAALAELERLKSTTDLETRRALDELKTRFTSVSREVTAHMGSLSSRFSETSEEMRRRAQAAAADITVEQQRLTRQLENLPVATRESADAMRHALQDQLRALDQLSSLTTREQRRRDVMPPSPPPGIAPAATPSLTAAFSDARAAPRDERTAPPISAIAESIAQQMAARGGAPAALPPPAAAQPASPQAGAGRPAGEPAREGWSLGDLLARASRDEVEPPPMRLQHLAPSPPPAPLPAPTATAPSGGLNIDSIARALDAGAASAIWARFRAGQRGIMVRSIYTADGRQVFDEVSRRYRSESDMRSMVDRYLAEFERLMQDTERKDTTGRLLQGYLLSDSGRVYLFLAHAAGRLT